MLREYVKVSSGTWSLNQKSKVTETQYIEMIRLKTAVLLGFSLELGALLADASLSDRKILYDAGINLGIGFQLKDDLLDVYADKRSLASRWVEISLRTKRHSCLSMHWRNQKEKDKAELQKWLKAEKFDLAKKVKAITALYDNLSIKSLTEKKINEYFEKGFAGLNKLSVNEAAKPLISFARDLVDRQK